MNLFYEEWKTNAQLSTKEKFIRNDFKVLKKKNIIRTAIAYLITSSISNKFDVFKQIQSKSQFWYFGYFWKENCWFISRSLINNRRFRCTKQDR